jgi:hypothetical protein
MLLATDGCSRHSVASGPWLRPASEEATPAGRRFHFSNGDGVRGMHRDCRNAPDGSGRDEARDRFGETVRAGAAFDAWPLYEAFWQISETLGVEVRCGCVDRARCLYAAPPDPTATTLRAFRMAWMRRARQSLHRLPADPARDWARCWRCGASTLGAVPSLLLDGVDATVRLLLCRRHRRSVATPTSTRSVLPELPTPRRYSSRRRARASCVQWAAGLTQCLTATS